VSFADNERFFSKSRVIPVLTPQSVEEGVNVSRALFEGGLRLHEITLRTAAGIETIIALRKETPGLVVGAGSVLTAEMGQAAIGAGASFLVSPGTTDALLEFAATCSVPFLPGAGSVSEAMRLLAMGCTMIKLFPAEPLGGVRFLQAISGPLASMKFCPTGGIHATNAPDYLKLANVTAVGGSWMAPNDLVKAKDFSGIRRLAEQAASL
jgi:2-dehydro-3-deoxyphosphogluconate aldolase/(4S)-4-hydroxy-2-oxoglutarate aldolase